MAGCSSLKVQRTQAILDLSIGLSMFIPFGICAGLTSSDQLVNFFPDDAFYYLQTAANFAQSGMATFDGVHETSGFHPLYFLLVALLAWLGGKSLLLHTVVLLHGLCICVSAVLIGQTTKQLPDRFRALLIIFFCLPGFFFFIWINAGMEASLVLLATGLFFLAWEQAAEEDFCHTRANLILGTSMAGLFLVRLDTIIGLVPFVLYLLGRPLFQMWRARSIQSIHSVWYLLTVVIIPFFAGAAYLSFNYVTTDHLLPINAVVKHIFFIPFEVSWQASTRSGNVALSLLAIFPFITALSSFPLLFWFAKQDRQSIPSGVLLLNLAVLAYYTYLRFFASNFFSWYFAFPLAMCALILVHIVDRILVHRSEHQIRPRLLRWMIGVGAGINLTFLLLISHTYQSTSYHLKQIAQQIDSSTPPEAVVGVFDAGAIGFFSSRQIINLDGLANNHEYLLNFRVPQRFAEYFRKEGVSHVLVRGTALVNLPEVQLANYERARFGADESVILNKKDELFRYRIPRTFEVFYYRLSSG